METHARIPIADLTLTEARDLVDDDSFWWDTMAAVLHRYPQIGPATYWELTVREHRLLVDYLVASGLAGIREGSDGTSP